MQRRLVALAALALLPAPPTLAQDAKPLVVQGKLTRDDAPDPTRKGPRQRVHEVKLTAGRAYCIDLDSADFDALLRLEDAAGKALAINDDRAPNDRNARLGFIPPKSGAYRLVVTSFKAGETGAYELRVEALTETAKPVVHTGKLTREDPTDRGRHYLVVGLQAVPGQLCWIDLESDDFDPALLIVDRAGKQIANDDDGGGGLNARVLFEPRPGERYRAIVIAVKAGAVGAYRITHRTFAAPEAALPDRVPLPEAPPALTIGRLTDKDPPDPVRKKGPHRVHPVRLEAGKGYLIDLRSGDFDPLLRLEDAAGKSLAEDDDSGGGTDAQVVFAPPKSGEYRAVAAAFHGTGQYDLAVTRFATLEAASERARLERTQWSLIADGMKAMWAGDLDRAVRLTRRAAEWAERLFPPERYPDGHDHLALALSNLGGMLREAGDREGGQRYFLRALEVMEKLYSAARYPDGHPMLARGLANVAAALHSRKDLDSAISHARRALAMCEKLYPDRDHLVLAQSLNTLGALLMEKGDLSAAEPLLRRAVAQRERLLRAGRQPDADAEDELDSALTNLATCLDRQDRPAEVEPLLRRSLALREKLRPAAKYPEGHPEVASCLNRLATALAEQGKNTEAEIFYRKSLAMREKLHPAAKYPNGHADLAGALSALGRLLHAEGRSDEGEPLVRRAVAMYEKLYAAGGPADELRELVICLNNFGKLLDDRGDYTEGVAYLRRALAACEKLYPEKAHPDGHPELIPILNNLGLALQHGGDLGGGERQFRRALALCDKHYPAKTHPDGHVHVGMTLNNLGYLLSERGDMAAAEPLYRRSLALCEKLYPASRYPDGHPYLATVCNNLAKVLEDRGDLAAAEVYLRRALTIFEKLHPPARYPDGHPALSSALSNLGLLLEVRGEHGAAEPYLRKALTMREKLYPGGHPDLAASLSNLGSALLTRGRHDEAEAQFRRALALREKLYPESKYPGGHPDLAHGLNNLAGPAVFRQDFVAAERLFRKALAVCEKLYPEKEFPAGHPLLAGGYHNVGACLRERGEYAAAEPLLRKAMAMYERLYPEKDFPNGHRDLARSYQFVADLLACRDDRAGAAALFARALDTERRLATAFAEMASETEALNLVVTFPRTRDRLLSMTAGARDITEVYGSLWRSKAVLSRALEGRRRLLRGLDNPDARRRLEELLQLRHRVASLALTPARADDRGRAALLDELTRRKEDLEKELARSVPELARQQARLAAGPNDLAVALPRGTAFVDLYFYRHWDARQGLWDVGNYVAFVIRRGEPTRRVELGPAPPVDRALGRWRQAIAAGGDGDLDRAALRQLLWDPLLPYLAGADTVYLSASGALHGLPWAALPSAAGRGVLLEECAVAVVPHGPALLDHLLHPPRDDGPGTLLAVGAVSYDRAEKGDVAALRDLELIGPAHLGGKVVRWGALPGTARELDAVLAVARSRDVRPQVIERRGEAAATWRVLRDLEGARWAHLATHGFFATPETRAGKALLDERLFIPGVGLERRGAARNPLAQSGLALAGANLAPKSPEGDRGLLTAEAIAGLRLDGLRLAVLSACETGLGEVEASGEGVLGLVRAFHLGGARDVVASLWKVEDQATAALMTVFYHRLWSKSEAPLAALRAAQLALYRHPGEVAALADPGGPEFAAALRRVMGSPPASGGRTAPPRQWAAFVLSGPGR